MSAAEQLTLDGRSVPHDEVVRGPSTSRMVRRPAHFTASQPYLDRAEWLLGFMGALDAAGVRPGEAFYVSRVPPVPVSAPAPGGARRSDPSTSKRAAAMVAPRTGSQRHALLTQFAVAALTAEQACRCIGKPGAWRRVSELLKGGYIVETGREKATRSGAMAEVYEITDKGRDAIAPGKGTP